MSVTVRDVAKAAGVSASTVSRTITNQATISEATKKKVRKAMMELGYVPPKQKQTVSSGTFHDTRISGGAAVPQGAAFRRIGIVLPPVQSKMQENSFFLEVIKGISSCCNQRSCSVYLVNGSSPEELRYAVRSLFSENAPDGMILLYSHKNDPVTEDLISSGVPFILVGKPASEEGDQSFIDNDNIAAAREAAAYLAGLGHTKIGFLSNRSEEQFNADRKAGYLLALAEHALPIRPEWILESDGTKERTEELLGQFLSLPELPSALLAVDDLLAVLTMRQVLAKGLRIPEDLSIVSFNDSLLSRITLPALTSVDVQAERLGVEAAAQLLMRLDHPDLPANKVIVPHRLVIRESCTAVSTS